jgi:broad specificity phosphatase PhoE
MAKDSARDSTTIYLVEHGETPGDGTPAEKLHGWNGDGITDAGKEKLAATVEYLRDKNIGETYSSDLPRAVQTANLIHDGLGVTKPNTERMGLRPMNVGTLAGMRKDEVQQQLTDAKSRPWSKLPGGESYGKFLGRFGQELHRTIQEALGEEYNCVYVTHSHNLGALAHLLSGGTAPARLDGPVGSGGVIALHVSDGGGRVSMEPVLHEK